MANDPRFEVYPRMHAPVTSKAEPVPTGDYGWRFRAANGQISAIGGEGFTRREDAHRAVSDFVDTLYDVATGSFRENRRPVALDVED